MMKHTRQTKVCIIFTKIQTLKNILIFFCIFEIQDYKYSYMACTTPLSCVYTLFTKEKKKEKKDQKVREQKQHTGLFNMVYKEKDPMVRALASIPVLLGRVWKVQ